MFDELLRLLLLVQVMFQPPAFQPRALVREDRDHIVRLHAHFTFGGFGDECSRQRRGELGSSSRRHIGRGDAVGGLSPSGRCAL